MQMPASNPVTAIECEQALADFYSCGELLKREADNDAEANEIANEKSPRQVERLWIVEHCEPFTSNLCAQMSSP